MRVGFYAGSFDPFTNGHLNIVKKASKLFDKVIVGMGVNPKKNRSFDKTQMKDAINTLFKNEGLSNCECIIYDGLTVDAAKQYDTTYLIRGIRNGMDYDFAVDKLKQATRNFAKRQVTFFKGMPYIEWFELDAAPDYENVVNSMEQRLVEKFKLV